MGFQRIVTVIAAADKADVIREQCDYLIARRHTCMAGTEHCSDCRRAVMLENLTLQMFLTSCYPTRIADHPRKAEAASA